MKTISLALSLIFAVQTFAAIRTITTVGNTFSPDSTVIRFGDTVQFTNMVGHNAVEVSAATWNANGTTPLAGGFSTVVSGNTITGLSVGLHYYICTPNAALGMKGRIWVLPRNGDLVDCSELFISEYIEGSGNNKSIEIFNPGPSARSLTGYSLVLYSNGSMVGSTYNLAGTINPNATYVVSNSGSALTILSVTNATNNTAINFNGNDAIALVKNNTILDVVGEIGVNPGVYWIVGVSDSTKDMVLVRKSAYKKGNTNWANSAANEWIGYNKDTFSYLGNHTMNPCIFPTIRFVKRTDTVSENAGTVLYQLSISNFSTSVASSVQVVFSGGTGNAADHTYTTQTITFPANSGTNQTLSIPIVDDNLIESMETLDFSIRNPSAGAAIGGDSVLTISIRDNDTLKVNFMGSLVSGKENSSSLGLPVKLSHLSPNPTTITFGVKAGTPTATLGTDFSFTPNTLVIPANDTTTKLFNVGIINDLNIEGTENAQIEITNINNNGAIGNNNFIDIAIEDDDTLRAVFVINADNFSENIGLASVGVRLTAFSPNPTSVSTNIPTGTATAMVDYTPVISTVNFGINDTATKYFTANIVDDILNEGSETIVLSMNATNGAITAGQLFTGTIIDNDNNPELAFNTTASGVNENAGTHQFQVKLKNKSPNATSASIQAFGGSASGSDFNINVGTVNFPANDSLPKTVSLNIANDIFIEGNETIQFRLINLTNNSFVGSDSIHTVTIFDNDTLKAIFNATASSVDEISGKARIGVSLNAFSPNATTLNLNSPPSGTAALGADFTQDTSSVTFAANDTATQYFTFNIIDDASVESNETFTYTINGNNGVITAGQSHTTTIMDNDFAQFNFSAVNVNRQEGSGLQNFNVSISKASSNASSIQVQLGIGSTASPATDYIFSTQTLNFAAGSTGDQAFTISLPDDIAIEGNETLVLKLSNATGGVLIGSDSSFTLTINDNDTLKARFPSQITNATEISGLVKIPVQLTALSNSSTNVTIAVKASGNNTATDAADYSISSNTITIGANDTAINYFNLNIVNDLIVEDAEIATFEITSVSNGGNSIGDEHVMTIADNDTLRALFVTNARSFNENSNLVQVGVKLSAFSSNATSVSASFAGGTATLLQDFSPSVINVVFNAMDTATKFFTANIIDDTLIEPNETFSIGLNATNGAITAGQLFTGTIIDNEIVPRVSFETANSISSENMVMHVIQVKLNNPNNKPTNVTVQAVGGTMSGSDYLISNSLISFAANDSIKKNLQIIITNDNLVEGTETLILKLINPTNNAVIAGDSLHTITLSDNDTIKLSFSELSRVYNENAGAVKVGVKIANRINQNITVDVSAKQGTASFSDFNFTKTSLTWAANDTATKLVDVQIVNDLLNELNETFTLQLENQTAGALISSGVFNITIIDNDTSNSGNTAINSIGASIYPNPFMDYVKVRCEYPIKTITVYDLSGKAILQRPATGYEQQIELSQLDGGIYLLEVLTEGNTYRRRIEKK
jgi:plastocyanin